MTFSKLYRIFTCLFGLLLSFALAACDAQPKSNLRDGGAKNGNLDEKSKLTARAATSEMAAVGLSAVALTQKIAMAAMSAQNASQLRVALDSCLQVQSKTEDSTQTYTLQANARRCNSSKFSLAGEAQVVLTRDADKKIQRLTIQTTEGGLLLRSKYIDHTWVFNSTYNRTSDYTFSLVETATLQSVRESSGLKGDVNSAGAAIQAEGEILITGKAAKMLLQKVQVTGSFSDSALATELTFGATDKSVLSETACDLPQGDFAFEQNFTEKGKDTAQAIDGVLTVRGQSIRESSGRRSSRVDNCRGLMAGALPSHARLMTTVLERLFGRQTVTTSHRDSKDATDTRSH